MSSRQIAVERFDIVSAKPFEQVLVELEKGIGRPDRDAYFKQKAAAQSFEEYARVVNDAVGASDLMEFIRFDPGAVLRKDPAAKAFKMVRIVAGNPLIMKQMAEHVPDAGSYAPVTILVSERGDGVHLSYDSMTSYLMPYDNAQALDIAQALDQKVIRLLEKAAA